MGLLCGIHYERMKKIGRWPYIAGAACAFLAGTFFADETYPKLLAMGIYSCCLVVGLADLDIRSRAILRLGDASYGIYLLHFPPMYAVSLIYPHAGDVWLFVTGMICGVGFGLFDHWLYRQTTAIASWQDAFDGNRDRIASDDETSRPGEGMLAAGLLGAAPTASSKPHAAPRRSD
jgi:peptidoglycan/LPS O-acetylase OafA/YrhL